MYSLRFKTIDGMHMLLKITAFFVFAAVMTDIRAVLKVAHRLFVTFAEHFSRGCSK